MQAGKRSASAFVRAALAGAACAMVLAPVAAQAQKIASGKHETYRPYQPQDEDERGLWMKVDELERQRATSPLVIGDYDLNEYVRAVLCRTVGEAECAQARIYIVRTPQFNATMAPNGMMEVWSGLLLRMENEAQLAAVLAHEYSHFEERHSVRLFRNARDKTNAAGFLNIVPFGGLIGLGLMTSIFGFSREMEREADTGSIGLLAKAGYDTREAAALWRRLREEMDRTAEARGTKSRKDKDGGLFGTHPPTAERVEALTALAAEQPGKPDETGELAFREIMQYHWSDFVEDQLKLNDFGATEFLLESLARSGWSADLLYARGELYRRQNAPEYLAGAETYYDQAIAQGGEIAELWRGRGLVRLKLGRPDAARADLREYLARSPEAHDAAMIAMLAGVTL